MDNRKYHHGLLVTILSFMSAMTRKLLSCCCLTFQDYIRSEKEDYVESIQEEFLHQWSQLWDQTRNSIRRMNLSRALVFIAKKTSIKPCNQRHNLLLNVMLHKGLRFVHVSSSLFKLMSCHCLSGAPCRFHTSIFIISRHNMHFAVVLFFCFFSLFKEMNMFIVCVVACPTGMVGTYITAEILEHHAKRRGHEIRIEIQGLNGYESELTKEECTQADGVIIATNIQINKPQRFENKITYQCGLNYLMRFPDAPFIALEDEVCHG